MFLVGLDVGYFCVKIFLCSFENNFYYQEVYLNIDFFEEVVMKVYVFFKEVVVLELLIGSVKKGMVMIVMCELVVNNDIGIKESVVDFFCGKCGVECFEEFKECKEMSIGCDCCDKWFYW